MIAVAAFAALSACSTGPDDTNSALTPADSGEITVKITQPGSVPEGQKRLLAGEFTVAGTFSATKGVKVATVTTTLPDETPFKFTISGNAFSGTLDTKKLDKKVLPDKMCGKKISLTISASDAKATAVGATQLEFEVDHCAPAVQLTSPMPPDPKAPDAPTPVYIGKVPVAGKIVDPNFKSGVVGWRQAGGDLVVERELKQPGPFAFVLDRDKEPTAQIEIVVNGVDNANNPTEIVAPITVLRRPSFLGNSDDNDQFPFQVADAAPVDVDGDGVLDVVQGGPDGVVMRLAKTAASATGGVRGTGRFAGKAETDANPLAYVPGWKDQKLAVQRLLVVDIDGHAASEGGPPDDLIVAGSLGGKPSLVALVRVAQNVAATPTLPASVRRGYRPIASLALEEPAVIAELAKIDGDERPDVVVAGDTDNKGLVVALSELAPACKDGKDFKPCSEVTPEAMLKVTEAKVFHQAKTIQNNKGLSAISSIAVGNFWKDPQKLDDICVGDSKRNFVSCYRNIAGNGDLLQAQDSYQFFDAADTSRILKVEYTQPQGDDGPDLIVVTKSGHMRWLKGNYNGLFFEETDAKGVLSGRNIYFDSGITDVVLANVGPAKAPYLVVVAGGREVTVVPLYPSDNSHVATCFRSWIMGGTIKRTVAADFDNDDHGYLDLMAVDAGPPPGVPVWLGLADGDFRAPRVYHLCAVSEANRFGPREVAVARVVDFAEDKKPELLAFGKASNSYYAPKAADPLPDFKGGCGPNSPGAPVIPFSVWTLHYWHNKDGLPQLVPRVAEFSPNTNAFATKAGSAVDCVSGTTEKFGSPVAWAFGDLDGDKNLDVAVVRNDSDYFVGVPTKPDKCAECQLYSSVHEVENEYGPENSDAEAGTGLCCRNYRPDDKDKLNPLKGFGLGAPIKRASLLTFVHGSDKAKPFGLEAKHSTIEPLLIGAAYGQAAGTNPVDVAIGDFNGDKANDVAVAMVGSGDAKTHAFLTPRVRLFKGIGTGKVANMPFFGDKRPWLNKDTGALMAYANVEYRVLKGDPSSLLAADYGAAKALGLFAVQNTSNKVTPLVAAAGKEGPLKVALGDGVVVGDSVQACGARDVNQDTTTDLLCASVNAVGYCQGETFGDKSAFAAKKNLIESSIQMAAVDVADVNDDKLQDLVLLNKADHEVTLWLGDGKGGFAQYDGHLRALPEVRRQQLADLDGDGCTDVVVTSKMGVTLLRGLSCDKPK